MNPTPSTKGNYLWILETSDNVAPGLDALMICIQSRYAKLTALQHDITNRNNIIQSDINNLEIPNQGGLNVHKELYYHNNYTDDTFQRKTQYTNMTFVEHLPYRIISSHVNENVTKSYKSNYYII